MKIFQSRKFQAVILGVLATIGVEYLNMDQETAAQLADLIYWGTLGYIGGHTVTDVAHTVKNGGSNA